MHNAHRWVDILYLERCQTHRTAYPLRWYTTYMHMYQFVYHTNCIMSCSELQWMPLQLLCDGSTNTCICICVYIYIYIYMFILLCASPSPLVRSTRSALLYWIGVVRSPALPCYTESVGIQSILVARVFIFHSECIYKMNRDQEKRTTGTDRDSRHSKSSD